ncbi:MAG: head-tail adaptor protein [Planctomycetota bacterium]
MTSRVRSGEYRYPIIVQRKKAAAVQDAFGQVDEAVASNWETYCSRRAKKETLPGNEPVVGDQAQPVFGHRLVVRADGETKGITPLMRVSWEGRLLNIQSVELQGYRLQEVLLICREQ